MKMPDLDKAFPKTPSYVHHCVLAAFEEGERRSDLKKRRRAGICALSAVLLVFVMGGIALKSRLEPAPDGRLTALSAQGDAAPSPSVSLLTPNPTPTAESNALMIDWNDLASAALYADGYDECLGQCDSSQCDLTYLIATTLTCQTELTSYVSASFEAPLRLVLTKPASDSEGDEQTLNVRLSWNSGLNLFEMDGRYWALENGCDALFEALGIDEDALLDRLSGRITYTIEESEGDLPTPAPTQTASATPDPLPTEQPTELPDGEIAALTPGDIHDLALAELRIGESIIVSLEDEQSLQRLESMLSGAEPLAECSCPFAPQLALTGADGTLYVIEPAYDGCSTVRCGNACYSLSETDGEEIWDLFGLSSDDVLEALLALNLNDDPIAFTLPGSSYYHVCPECNAFSVEMEAYLMLSSNADIIDEYTGHISGAIISTRSACTAQGLSGCAYCALSVYAAPGDIFYHATAECAHSSQSMLLVEMEEPRAACPLCMGGAGDVYDSLGEELVLCTEKSDLYHKSMLCPTALSELENIDLPAETDTGLAALFQTEDEALHALGLTPCPYCAETVYATAGGQWYHADPACSGMMNAQACTILEAEALGKPACPICLPDRSSDSSNYPMAEPTPSYTPTPESENVASIGSSISDD